MVGTEFEVDKLMDVKAGPLHSGNLDEVKFVQGPFTVAYSPGVRRGLTHSNVRILTAKGEWEDNVVGDDRPMVIEGYRFYTTFNKGFSSILTWIPDDGVPVTGTINMPSYPLFEYKQDNRWEPPGSNQEIKFWLQLKTGMDENNHWILDGRTSTGVLIVSTDEQRHEVQVGESVRLRNGMLRFEALTTWMGYRLFYDPTIQWMFFVSVMGVLGLGQYFWKKTNLQPWMDEKPDTIVSGKERPLVELGSKNAGNQYSDGETVSTGMAAGERR